MTRIDFFFSGYYGMGNYGDDLFGITCLHAAKSYWHEGAVSLDVPRDYMQSHDFHRLIRTRTTTRQRGGVFSRGSRLRDGLIGARRAERFVLGGGSILQSGRLNARSLALAAGTAFFGTRRSAIGVSVGPFATPEDGRRVGKQLGDLEFLAVRDGTSIEAASEINPGGRVVEAADLAGVYAKFHPGRPAAHGGVDTVGFAPCRQKDGADYRFCDAFVGALGLHSHDLGERPKVKVLCLNVHPRQGDLDLCDYTERALLDSGFTPERIRYDEIGVAATWAEIGKTDLFVSGRLHGAMTAYLQRVPFLLHEYHRKCRDWLRDIRAASEAGVPGSALVAQEMAERMRAVRGLEPGVAPEAYSTRAEANFTSAPWAQ